MKRFLVLGVALVLMAVLAADVSAAERKGMFGFGVGGGGSLPLGALKDDTAKGGGAKLGWRIGGGVGYFIMDNIAIGAQGVLAQNKAKDETIRSLKAVDARVTDAKAQLIEFNAWVKRFFNLQSEKISPYVQLGLGGLSYKNKVDPETADSLNTTGNPYLTESEVFLGGNIGGGVMYEVAPKVSLFLEAAFHNYAKSDFAPRNYVEAHLGVAYMFGGTGVSTGGGTTE